MAAVMMSPPQVSSIVIAMPRATQRSRIWRARVSPPTLEILRLITSMAWSAWPRSTISSPSITSSSTNGRRCAGGRRGTPRRQCRAARYRRRRRGPRRTRGPPRAWSSRCWHRRSARRRLEHRRAGPDALDVGVDVAADLELELGVALGAVAARPWPPSPRACPARWRGRARSLAVAARPAACTTGRPAALPRMSQQAMSSADFT